MAWTPVAKQDLYFVARIIARRASQDGVRGFDLEGVFTEYHGPYAFATDDPDSVALFYGHDLVLTDCPGGSFRPAKYENGRYFVELPSFSRPPRSSSEGKTSRGKRASKTLATSATPA
jgi:hypothetical protein